MYRARERECVPWGLLSHMPVNTLLPEKHFWNFHSFNRHGIHFPMHFFKHILFVCQKNQKREKEHQLFFSKSLPDLLAKLTGTCISGHFTIKAKCLCSRVFTLSKRIITATVHQVTIYTFCNSFFKVVHSYGMISKNGN